MILEPFLFLLVSTMLAGSAIEAPAGCSYAESSDLISQELELVLVCKTKSPTDIHFSFDRRDLRPIFEKSSPVDKSLELFVPSLGSTAWEPHIEDYDFTKNQTQRYSLAVIFSKLFNLPISDWNVLQASEADYTFFSFQDWLNQNQSEAAVDSVEKVGDEIDHLISETERFFFGDLPSLSPWIESHNIVDAIRTTDRSEGTRLDAFSRRIHETFIKYPDEFLEALQFLALNPTYILRFVVSVEKFPYPVRLACLMLLSHNHLAEEFLIRSIAGQFGVIQAYDSFQALNRIYRNERDYWKSKSSEHKDVGQIFGSRVTSFGREVGNLAINMSLRENILEPLSLLPSNQLTDQSLLAYVQRYHYYGAFALSLLMKDEWNLSETNIRRLVTAAGSAYKLRTMGLNRKQLDLLRDFYSAGSRDALRLYDFIRR